MKGFCMSINDIKNMPIQERMQLMEMLLDSFSNEEEDIKSPDWHQEILDERARQIEKGNTKTYTLAELKARR